MRSPTTNQAAPGVFCQKNLTFTKAPWICRFYWKAIWTSSNECTWDFWLHLVLVRRTSLVQRTRTRSSGQVRLETVIGIELGSGNVKFQVSFQTALEKRPVTTIEFWFSSPWTFRASVWCLVTMVRIENPSQNSGTLNQMSFTDAERLFHKRSKQILIPILFPQVPNCVPLRFLTTKFPGTRNSWSVGFECFLNIYKIQMESMM